MTARRAEGEEEDLHEQDGPTGEAKDLGSIPGLGRSPGERNAKALQYSGSDNPMDRGPGRLQSMGSQRVRHD